MGYKLKKYTLYEYDGQKILLHGFDGYKKIGFCFQDGHSADPVSKARTNKNVIFSYVKDDRGWAQFEFDSLPSNILILKENWYWHQTLSTDINNEIRLVTKEDSYNILREDILEFINKTIFTKNR